MNRSIDPRFEEAECRAAHPFRRAIESGDIDAAVALLTEDVVLRSPVAFRPYCGRAAVAPVLHAVAQVFEDFCRG
jgi:ketosteroid isomerase-like protein